MHVPGLTTLAAAGLLGSLLVVTAPADAAEPIVVTTTDDFGPGSLRGALYLAGTQAGDDLITFAPSVRGSIALDRGPLRTYVGDGDDGDLTIQGPGADALAIDGLELHRVLHFDGQGVQPPTVTISGLTLTRGAAYGEGRRPDGWGGAVLATASDLTLDNVVISHSRATLAGGGVFVEGGDLLAVDTVVHHNEAAHVTRYSEAAYPYGLGGGLAGESITLVRSVVSHNHAMVRGGGVDARSLVMRDSTVASNSTRGRGGGLVVAPCESFEYSRCQQPAAAVDVTSSTIVGNRADVGGGIWVDRASTLTLTLASVTHNAAVTGGGLATGVVSPVLRGAAVAMNTGGDLSGAVPVIDRAVVGQDPLLGPMDDHGGPTPTVLPAPGSPLVDAGAAFGEMTDQRGSARPVDAPDTVNADGGDGSDIGAVELTTDELDGRSQVANTAAPVVTGRVRVGETLRTDSGSWSPTDAELSYQWLRDGEPIGGATAAAYTLTADDFGRNLYGDDRRTRLSVVVTAEAPGLREGVRESDLTAFVGRGRMRVERPASLRGRPIVGRTLQVRPRVGGIEPRPTGVRLVRWYVGGDHVRRAYGDRQLRLTRRMRGERVKAVITYAPPEGYRSLRQTVRTASRVR